MPSRRTFPPTILVAGTGTGVGKTVFAALLVSHLRRRGVAALGFKPISTGDRSDALLLRRAQDEALSLEAINPFHYRRPLAPMMAARAEGRPLLLKSVVDHLRQWSRGAECVVVEGAGGWRTPLGEGFSLEQLGRRMGAFVVVVGANRLGVIHQVRCTVESVTRSLGRPPVAVLSAGFGEDPSTSGNLACLGELLPPGGVVTMAKCRGKAGTKAWFERGERILKKTLAGIIVPGRFRPLLGAAAASRKKTAKKWLTAERQRISSV